MNKERRIMVANAHELLEYSQDILERCVFDEREAFGKLSSKGKQSEKGRAMSTAIDILDESIESIKVIRIATGSL